MPSGAFNICCPRDCVSRHNGGTSGSALRALSSLRGLRGAPEVPSLFRETWVSRTANVWTVGKNRLIQIPNAFHAQLLGSPSPVRSKSMSAKRGRRSVSAAPSNRVPRYVNLFAMIRWLLCMQWCYLEESTKTYLVRFVNKGHYDDINWLTRVKLFE